MKVSGLTTMLQFSVSPPVLDNFNTDSEGPAIVQRVTWFEQLGHTATFTLETWKLLAPDIWLVTSKKK